MAELFLQELGARFVAQPNFDDIVFDFIVGFENSKGGMNTIAVEVKSTEQPITNNYTIKKKLYNYLVHSNIPAMLLIVDVKRNEFYNAWPSDQLDMSSLKDSGNSVRVPVNKIDGEAREKLSVRMAGSEG